MENKIDILKLNIKIKSTKEALFDVHYIGETENDNIRTELGQLAQKFLKEEVLPYCKGLDVLTINETEEPMISAFSNENDDVIAGFYLPQNVIDENEEGVNLAANEMIKLVVDFANSLD